MRQTLYSLPKGVAYTVSAEFAFIYYSAIRNCQTLCSNCDQSVYATTSIYHFEMGSVAKKIALRKI